jgi:hypothetical protein
MVQIYSKKRALPKKELCKEKVAIWQHKYQSIVTKILFSLNHSQRFQPLEIILRNLNGKKIYITLPTVKTGAIAKSQQSHCPINLRHFFLSKSNSE